jgi:hypothetical protein
MKIIRQLLEIVLRKRQPQDLDYDLNAAVTSVICSIGIVYLIYSSIPYFSKPLAYSSGLVLLKAICIYAFLAINGKSKRFVQTISAIFGATVILYALALVMSQISILGMLALLLLLWNFILGVLIIKAALECSAFKAALIMIACQLIVSAVMPILFPTFHMEIQLMLDEINAAVGSAGVAQ